MAGFFGSWGHRSSNVRAGPLPDTLSDRGHHRCSTSKPSCGTCALSGPRGGGQRGNGRNANGPRHSSSWRSGAARAPWISGSAAPPAIYSIAANWSLGVVPNNGNSNGADDVQRRDSQLLRCDAGHQCHDRQPDDRRRELLEHCQRPVSHGRRVRVHDRDDRQQRHDQWQRGATLRRGHPANGGTINLSGGGTINLNDPNSLLTGSTNGHETLVNMDNMIQGSGLHSVT